MMWRECLGGTQLRFVDNALVTVAVVLHAIEYIAALDWKQALNCICAGWDMPFKAVGNEVHGLTDLELVTRHRGSHAFHHRHTAWTVLYRRRQPTHLAGASSRALGASRRRSREKARGSPKKRKAPIGCDIGALAENYQGAWAIKAPAGTPSPFATAGTGFDPVKPVREAGCSALRDKRHASAGERDCDYSSSR